MYSHKDSDDKQKEHMLLLKSLNTRKIIFLKRRKTSRNSYYGSFFVLNELGQCIDITYSIAVVLGKEMVYLDSGARAIDVMYADTIMRDISELLYGKWDRFTLYTLE